MQQASAMATDRQVRFMVDSISEVQTGVIFDNRQKAIPGKSAVAINCENDPESERKNANPGHEKSPAHTLGKLNFLPHHCWWPVQWPSGAMHDFTFAILTGLPYNNFTSSRTFAKSQKPV